MIVHHIWRFELRAVAIPFDFLLEYAKMQLKARIITERFAMLFRLRVVRACVGEWHEVYVYTSVGMWHDVGFFFHLLGGLDRYRLLAIQVRSI